MRMNAVWYQLPVVSSMNPLDVDIVAFCQLTPGAPEWRQESGDFINSDIDESYMCESKPFNVQL
jgi:hypothetical protein